MRRCLYLIFTFSLARVSHHVGVMVSSVRGLDFYSDHVRVSCGVRCVYSSDERSLWLNTVRTSSGKRCWFSIAGHLGSRLDVSSRTNFFWAFDHVPVSISVSVSISIRPCLL